VVGERKPIHILAKKEDIAPNAIVVGDPRRVVLISKLLSNVRVVNENRGLLTVTGRYSETNITVATHGIGAPSAAIVFEELRMYGVKRIVRLGTCGSIREDIEPGTVVVALSSIYDEGGCGLKRYYNGFSAPTAPDPYLAVRVMEEMNRNSLDYYTGIVYCSDSFYSEESVLNKLIGLGITCIDMETAVLYGLSWLRGFNALSILIVSNNIVKRSEHYSSDMLESKILKTAKAIIEVFDKHYSEG